MSTLQLTLSGNLTIHPPRSLYVTIPPDELRLETKSALDSFPEGSFF